MRLRTSSRGVTFLAYWESPVPVLAARGNHDDNSFFAENVAQTNNRADVVDTDWLAEHLIGPLIDDQCVANSNQAKGCTCYYRDFPEARVRTVVLDSCDVPYTADASGTRDYRSLIEFGVGTDQMAWLADEALRFDEPGWAVVILSHVNLDDNRPYGLRAWGEVPVWDLGYRDGSGLPEIFNFYRRGTFVTDDGTQLMTEHMLFGDEEPPQIEHAASWTDLAIVVANG